MRVRVCSVCNRICMSVCVVPVCVKDVLFRDCAILSIIATQFLALVNRTRFAFIGTDIGSREGAISLYNYTGTNDR